MFRQLGIILSVLCLVIALLLYGRGMGDHSAGAGYIFIAGSIALLASVISFEKSMAGPSAG